MVRVPGYVVGGLLVVSLLSGSVRSGVAQDANVRLPPGTIETRLARDAFEIVTGRGARFEGDRTRQRQLAFPDGTSILVKWAVAPPGGEEFNNNPRYEVAAYEIQKLFLKPEEYVVPPTVVRSFSLAWYREEVDPGAHETLHGTGAVLATLHYWLWNVGPDTRKDGVWDPERFEADPAYAHGFANVNILTYLIRHMDANKGNFLASLDPERPRIFAVDNGVAFRSPTSDRGDWWRHLRVDRLPRSAVERLRALELEQLRARLGVLAQFERREGGAFAPVEPTENLDPARGVRWDRDVIQLGLTDREIRDVWGRLEKLLRDVERGRVRTFEARAFGTPPPAEVADAGEGPDAR